jgi:hypothetical protein
MSRHVQRTRARAAGKEFEARVLGVLIQHTSGDRRSGMSATAVATLIRGDGRLVIGDMGPEDEALVRSVRAASRRLLEDGLVEAARRDTRGKALAYRARRG